MDGLHILANFYHCAFDFTHEATLVDKVAHICTESGLTVVGQAQHAFSPQGLTFTILLAESHVCCHTWPETKSVAVDVYTCNFQQDNSSKTRYVIEAIEAILKPSKVEKKEVLRHALNQ